MIELKKMYSAFISSTYSNMKQQRQEVIDTLLDYRIFPICMEHFTVSADNNFSDITSLIDESDIFIILLGKNYGTIASNGKSITENEYNYAMNHKIKCLAIITEDLVELLNLPKDEKEKLSENEKKQIQFALSVPYAKQQAEHFPLSRIISQFLGNLDLSNFKGWTRSVKEQLTNIPPLNNALNINGKWYHVHTSSDDPSYIRAGIFDVEQKFDNENYTNLSINGSNFPLIFNKLDGSFSENIFKKTIWTGNYTLNKDGRIKGIFEARRGYNDNFNSIEITKGLKCGIHDFYIDTTQDYTSNFQGEFHDVAPSPKTGEIVAFRNKEQRDKYIKLFFSQNKEFQ